MGGVSRQEVSLEEQHVVRRNPGIPPYHPRLVQFLPIRRHEHGRDFLDPGVAEFLGISFSLQRYSVRSQ